MLSSPITPYGEKILRTGSIISPHESPVDMIDRITYGIRTVDARYHDAHDTEEFISSLRTYMMGGTIVPNTVIMTNLGRHDEKPLSACIVPDIDLKGDLGRIKQVVDDLHLNGMGTGFDLDNTINPITTLEYLNHLGVELQNSGRQERPVGNMGIMSIYNPHIKEFIQRKVSADAKEEKWNFNLSVSIDTAFMQALKNNQGIILQDGTKVPAKELFHLIATAAHSCADPGIIFMDRLQEGNTTPSVGLYSSVAPCGETGLAKGETCNFASINIASFIGEDGYIDYPGLKKVTTLLTRYLDDVTEYNIGKYNGESTESIMRAKRKIGIGVCGLADALLKFGCAYGDHISINLSRNVMSYINFISKQASVDLAKIRSPFGAFAESLYMDDYILKRYADHATESVSHDDWKNLNQNIKLYGIRNSNTIALPPTGRSALVFGVSQQIEPIFSLKKSDGSFYVPKDLLTHEMRDAINTTSSIQSCVSSDISDILKRVYRSASEISIKEHMDILAAFQEFSDESVSKTINLSSDATIEDVKQVYLDAYNRGFKGITIYRNNSKGGQPIALSK